MTKNFDAWAAKRYPHASRKDSLGGFSRDMRKSALEGWEAATALDAVTIAQQAALIAELEQQRGGVALPERLPIPKSSSYATSYEYATALDTALSHNACLDGVSRLNPPRKFRLRDPVRKTKGSQWSGRVVGFYSTELTPDGYAVESFTEKGSVQIYPGSALEPCEEPAECAGDQAGVMFGFNDKSVMVSQEAYQIFMDRERAYRDAYQGAREDLAIWKRRALEAEEKIRYQDQIIDRLTLEAQGETRFGEPVVGECVAVPRELSSIVIELCDAIENQADLPLNKWALKSAYLIGKVRALLAQQGKAVGDE